METLRSLFKNDDFIKIYLEHNTSKDHTCEKGKFRDFCCTETYQLNELFRNNPTALQIQLASDDFEICDPLQPKSNRHKICAIYFTIRNLPRKYLSKLNNIYLICLCNTDDIKTKRTDYNNIWRQVFQDIKYLETVGININDQLNIKGTITTVSFDNLGANTSLGFTGGFRATYYCRKCECSREECEKLRYEQIQNKRKIHWTDIGCCRKWKSRFKGHQTREILLRFIRLQILPYHRQPNGRCYAWHQRRCNTVFNKEFIWILHREENLFVGRN